MQSALLPSAAAARAPLAASAGPRPAPLRCAAPLPRRAAGQPGRGRLTVRSTGEESGSAGAGGSPSSQGADGDRLGGDGRKMADTLSALDALLGVEPEPPAKEEETKVCVRARLERGRGEEGVRRRGAAGHVSLSSNFFPLILSPHHPPDHPLFTRQPPSSPGVTFSPDVLRQLAEAEAGRAAGSSSSGAGKAGDKDALADDLAAKMAAVAEAARRAARARDAGGGGDKASPSSSPADEAKAEADLRAAFEKLVSSVSTGAGALGGADKADLQKLKDEVFGPRLFWVTETSPVDPFLADGWLIRGNLRTGRAAAFKAVQEGVARLFGDKYVVLMVEDPVEALEGMMEGGSAGAPAGKDGAPAPRPEPRIAFQVVTAAAAAPPSAPSWQPLAAAILAALSAGSSVQLGMAANISRLPPAVLEWLADPNGLAASGGSLPPFVEAFDPSAFIASALPIAGAILGIQAVHEAGHAAVARARGIKTSFPLLVPNGQLGTFGGITQLRSLLPDRAALFDFAAAGPLAGGGLAAVLFIVGLALSGGGGPVPDAAAAADTALAATGGLIPVPAALLQGSLLLGGVAKAALGSGGLAVASGTGALAGSIAARAAPVVLVHPLVVVGWAGLVATALNLLPVGRLDGGRMVQAAFGSTALGVASFLTYVGLALGFLGSALALPFGLFVLICQRDPEAPPADGVTEPEGPRAVVAAVAIGLALLVLLPAAPEVVDAGRAGGMFL